VAYNGFQNNVLREATRLPYFLSKILNEVNYIRANALGIEKKFII